MALKDFTLASPNQIRGDQLADEITSSSTNTASITVNELTFLPPLTVSIHNIPDGEESNVQNTINEHIPNSLYFPLDHARSQNSAAQVFYSSSAFSGLRQLSPEDATYAALGRAFAIKDGAAASVITGIVNRSTAATYVTNKPEWVNLTTAQRQWAADELDALAMVMQGIVRLID